MANYIQTLQAAVSDSLQNKNDALCEIAEFRAHLLSAKFQGLDSDGSRKDWIATADVLKRLEMIVQALDK